MFISNPHSNPQCMMFCTTSASFGSPRGLVSYCNTYPCYLDTVEVCGSSPHGPTISFSELASTTSLDQAPIGSIREVVRDCQGQFPIVLREDTGPPDAHLTRKVRRTYEKTTWTGSHCPQPIEGSRQRQDAADLTDSHSQGLTWRRTVPWGCHDHRSFRSIPTKTERKVMIDHVILTVSDFERSVAFYAKALKPLGITSLIDYEGKDGHPDLSFSHLVA